MVFCRFLGDFKLFRAGAEFTLQAENELVIYACSRNAKTLAHLTLSVNDQNANKQCVN